MSVASQIDYLLDYTEWDRAQWEAWFRTEGPETLAIGVGANADVRFKNVGELVRHIFSAERRYVERIQDLPVTDASTVAAASIEALFTLGRQSRARLRQLLTDFPADRWDSPRDVQVASMTLTITPRTMLVQAVTHEIRHWAQIASYLRMEGRRTGAHDFLVSGIFERNLTPASN
jgi:uncharacterized damage-inducible protein DinB